MLRRLALAAGLCVMAVALSPQIATAASVSPQTLWLGTGDTDGALVQQAQERKRYEYGRFFGYYNRCQYRARECRRRYAWGSTRYRLCLYWQGCRFR
jgi:hypothetical protein